jgi:hypothetical protein
MPRYVSRSLLQCSKTYPNQLLLLVLDQLDTANFVLDTAQLSTGMGPSKSTLSHHNLVMLILT